MTILRNGNYAARCVLISAQQKLQNMKEFNLQIKSETVIQQTVTGCVLLLKWMNSCRAFSTNRHVLKGNVKDVAAETQNFNTREKGVLSQQLQLSSNVLQRGRTESRGWWIYINSLASYCESTLCWSWRTEQNVNKTLCQMPYRLKSGAWEWKSNAEYSCGAQSRGLGSKHVEAVRSEEKRWRWQTGFLI